MFVDDKIHILWLRW